jgi:hypothetical protein
MTPSVRGARVLEPATVVACHGGLEEIPAHYAIDVSHPGADFKRRSPAGAYALFCSIIRPNSACACTARSQPPGASSPPPPRGRHQFCRHQRSAGA